MTVSQTLKRVARAPLWDKASRNGKLSVQGTKDMQHWPLLRSKKKRRTFVRRFELQHAISKPLKESVTA